MSIDDEMSVDDKRERTGSVETIRIQPAKDLAAGVARDTAGAASDECPPGSGSVGATCEGRWLEK